MSSYAAHHVHTRRPLWFESLAKWSYLIVIGKWGQTPQHFRVRAALPAAESHGLPMQADFSFFFDSGGRRRCYIAPERFHQGSTDDKSRTPLATPLHPAMVGSIPCP